MAEAQERLRTDSGTGRRSPDEIRGEIERTRSEMHETVDALERRLTPGEIFDEVWQRVRGSGGGGAGEIVRDHPVPLALMGLGLGWLAVEKATGRSDPETRHTRTTEVAGYGTAGAYESTTVGAEFNAEDEGKLDRIKQKASSVKDKASHLGDRASDAKDRVAGVASSAGHRVSETASHTADRVRGTARRAQYGLERMSSEQPLALGAITFGIGLAAGLMAPTTDWEDEHVGPISDRVKDSARETARDAKDVAREVAHEAKAVARETVDSVEESARETEGHSAGERIGEAVDRAKEAAMQSAERHHIDREGLRERGREVTESAKQHARDVRNDAPGDFGDDRGR